FDLLDWYRLPVRLQCQQTPQRRARAVLIVDELRVLLEDRVLTAARRVLKLEHGVRIEEVVLAVPAPLIFAAPVQIRLHTRAGRKRIAMPLQALVGNNIQADSADS